MATAIIACLLIVAIPASAALAATYDEDIDISPNSGEVDDYIDIEGWDFTPSDTEESAVDIYFCRDEGEPGDDVGFGQEVEEYEEVKSSVDVDEDGDFDTRFKVPDEVDDEKVVGGNYYICVTYENSKRIVAVGDFTVIAGEIEINPDEGVVGTEVEVSGENFSDEEYITIEYDDDDITDDIISGDDETDNDGEFSCTILIPESEAGDHTIKVSDESGSEAEAEFTVEPEMTINPTSGSPGTKVNVSATGFRGDRSITIYFGTSGVVTAPTSIRTDNDGSFSGASFTVPSVVSGTYPVKVNDGTNELTANFSISTDATLSPTTGNVGTTLTVGGDGFVASGTVTIKYDNTEVKTATVGTDGTFSTTFATPASKYGSHTILVSDGTNTKQLTFTMESTAPPIPKPLEPETDAKAQAAAYFDWEVVTDDSLPVTYTLQVATDDAFSASSIVLEKTGLTDSEYTLTEEEELESTEKDAPYFWRVRAIDAASNESGWTGTGSFSVGFAFSLTGWVLYLLMGIGGLLLLGIGYWIGKRSF